jgi:hypothetical protein
MTKYFPWYTRIVLLVTILMHNALCPMEKEKTQETEDKALGELIEKQIKEGGQEQAILKALESGASLSSKGVLPILSGLPSSRILNLFFEYGADISSSAIDTLFYRGLTPFSREKEQEMIAFIQWLVEHGYPILNLESPNRLEELKRAGLLYTFTQVSSSTSRLLAAWLLPPGALKLVQPEKEKSAELLVYYLVQGEEKEAQSEIEKFSKEELSPDQQTLINDALIIAVAQGYTEIVATILTTFQDSIQAETIQKAFINAVFNDHVASASLLIDHITKTKSIEDIRSIWIEPLGVALMIAAANGSINSIQLILGTSEEQSILSEFIGDINPFYIQSALVRATRWGHFTIARQLLDLIIDHKVRIKETWPAIITRTLTFAALQGDTNNLAFFTYVLRQVVKQGWSVNTRKVLYNIGTFLKNRFLSDTQRTGLENARATINALVALRQEFTSEGEEPKVLSQALLPYVGILPPEILNLLLAFFIGKHLEKSSAA